MEMLTQIERLEEDTQTRPKACLWGEDTASTGLRLSWRVVCLAGLHAHLLDLQCEHGVMFPLPTSHLWALH